MRFRINDTVLPASAPPNVVRTIGGKESRKVDRRSKTGSKLGFRKVLYFRRLCLDRCSGGVDWD
jgi:hypothetical protein